MSQAVDVLSDIIREELPKMYIELEPKIAPMFEGIMRTSMGVKSQDGLGKAYQVIHFYNTGTSGSFESGDPLGPAMSSMVGNQAQILAQGTAADNIDIFPDAQEVPHTGEVKRTLSLHKVNGNYSVPVAWRQLDNLNAAVLGKVARDLKAVAKKKLRRKAASFMSYEVTNSSGYVNQVLGRISAVAESGKTGMGDYIQITLDEQYGRIANFEKGQMVDVVADSSGTLQDGTDADTTDVRNYDASTNYNYLVVVDVDYLGKKITLRPIDSGDGSLPDYDTGWYGSAAFAGAANDWIVPIRSTRYTSGPRPFETWGLNSWIKNTGAILGGSSGDSGLDVDLYSMFKSQVIDVSASLTEDKLDAYIAGYQEAYYGEELDTIITTAGVTHQYKLQSTLNNNRFIMDRTGKSLNYVGGWSKVGYEFNGKKYDWVISPLCLNKTLYGLRMQNGNIQRYGPPRIGGSDGNIGPELEFLAPLAGFNGVFMPVTNSSTGRPMDLLQAPFWYFELLAPKDPRGLKLTNLTERSLTS